MRLMVAFAVVIILTSLYVTAWGLRLFSYDRLREKVPWLVWTVTAIPPVTALALFPITGNMMVTVVVLGHMAALLTLWDVLMLPVRWDRKKRNRVKSVLYAVSMLLCAGYLTYAAVNAHTVTPTYYTVVSEKMTDRENLRIAHISDCHLGTTFDGEGFARYMREIDGLMPDYLVITGDFVDERSTIEDIRTACAALGELRSPKEVFFVYGNHEAEALADIRYDLYRQLKSNGVEILTDEKEILLGWDADIYGRKDADAISRDSIEEMMELSREHDDGGSRFSLFLDHQPREYDEYAANGVDLVLSGHTHAGQMFPLGYFIEFIGMGENTYGMERRGDTTFIVSSGMSGLMPLRTGSESEYVIIDIIDPQN